MTKFPIIDVAGSPFECGLRIGQQTARQIQQAVETYMDVFAYYTGDDRDAILEKAAAYMPAIEAFDADIVQELRGVAEGAGVSLNEILALNARTELMSSAPIKGECTVFGALAPAVPDDEKIYLVQNWDWLMPTAHLPVILRIRQADKPVILTLCEAGQLGKIGMNSDGFGVCLNWLACNYRRIGVPVHIITRKLLSCRSVYAVVDTIYNSIRGAAANYMIGHRDGFLINFETTPDQVDYFEPQAGTLSHTNHFESHRFRPIDTGIKISGDSFPRLQRVRQLLSKHHGKITPEIIMDILRDQHFSPFGICTCPDPEDPEMDRWSTLSSVIYDLREGCMLITHGNPLETEYEELMVV